MSTMGFTLFSLVDYVKFVVLSCKIVHLILILYVLKNKKNYLLTMRILKFPNFKLIVLN